MRIPYRPKTFSKMTRPYRYLILHDVTCQFENMSEKYKDTNKFQTGDLRASFFIINGENDLNYHFICERIMDDYETVIGRPISVRCEYNDIVSPYNDAIHVAIMGDYNTEIPNARMYQQLAYRVVAPMMKTYRLTPSKILLHSDVTSSKNVSCPGSNFDMSVFLSHLKSMVTPR